MIFYVILVLLLDVIKMSLFEQIKIMADILFPQEETRPNLMRNPFFIHIQTSEDLKRLNEEYMQTQLLGADAYRKSIYIFKELKDNCLLSEEEKLTKREEKIHFASIAYQNFDKAYWVAVSVQRNRIEDRQVVINWARRELAMRKSIPLALFLKEDHVYALHTIQQALRVAKDLLESKEDLEELQDQMLDLVRYIMENIPRN